MVGDFSRLKGSGLLIVHVFYLVHTYHQALTFHVFRYSAAFRQRASGTYADDRLQKLDDDLSYPVFVQDDRVEDFEIDFFFLFLSPSIPFLY